MNGGKLANKTANVYPHLLYFPTFFSFLFLKQLFLYFFNIYFYLFGCTRSLLQHAGSSFLTRDWTQVSCIGSRVLAIGPPGKSIKQPSWTINWKLCAKDGRARVSETMPLVYQTYIYRMRKRLLSYISQCYLFAGSSQSSLTYGHCLHNVPSLFTVTLSAFPGGASGEEPACQSRRHKRRGFNPWVGKIAWRRTWQPIPVFMPGESHRQRSLAG